MFESFNKKEIMGRLVIDFNDKYLSEVIKIVEEEILNSNEYKDGEIELDCIEGRYLTQYVIFEKLKRKVFTQSFMVLDKTIKDPCFYIDQKNLSQLDSLCRNQLKNGEAYFQFFIINHKEEIHLCRAILIDDFKIEYEVHY
jgi:hypothetical protein